MYKKYEIQYYINFKFWASMLSESLCTSTGGCMTQYFIAILCDIVDHKIYSACVYLKSVNRFQRFPPISNLVLVVRTPHRLYNLLQYITPRDNVSNRIHTYEYILHNIIRISRYQAASY